MGRSQETYNKKEVRNKKEKKRQEKEKKREKRKSEGKASFSDMIAYADEFGRITSVPPDPEKKNVIAIEDIEITAVRNKPKPAAGFSRKGVVISFNHSRGFGFIRDLSTNESIFVHANSLEEPVKENNIVVYEIGKGAKGPAAIKVRLFVEESH